MSKAKQWMTNLQVDVHAWAQQVAQGIILCFSCPAVDADTLQAKLDLVGGSLAFLHGPQNVTEAGPLLAAVFLGTVLVTVGGQLLQCVTQAVYVVAVEHLRRENWPDLFKWNWLNQNWVPEQNAQKQLEANFRYSNGKEFNHWHDIYLYHHYTSPTYFIFFTSQFIQQGNGFASCYPQLHISTGQQLWQLGKVAEMRSQSCEFTTVECPPP